ncbi:hypothetical protein GOBAR_DD11064 [Gossypium barbadense]|nr:hypothetical protein GOBAR_DD11064 [Gossypium barbadense]
MSVCFTRNEGMEREGGGRTPSAPLIVLNSHLPSSAGNVSDNITLLVINTELCRKGYVRSEDVSNMKHKLQPSNSSLEVAVLHLGFYD